MSGSKYVGQKLFRSTLANVRIVMKGSCFSMLSFLYSDCRSLSIFLAFFVMPLCCLSFWTFSLCHCIVYLSGLFRYACIVCPSIYSFWLHNWYLQTFLECVKHIKQQFSYSLYTEICHVTRGNYLLYSKNACLIELCFG